MRLSRISLTTPLRTFPHWKVVGASQVDQGVERSKYSFKISRLGKAPRLLSPEGLLSRSTKTPTFQKW